MAVYEFLLPLAPCILSVLLYYLIRYVSSNRHLSSIPGPFIARFSNLWLLLQSRRGHRYLSVDAAHARYGKFVRIQPDHVSVADVDAIAEIYGHGNGFLKSEYYDSFVSIRRGLFNTRKRSEHSRKRKTIAHTFSLKSVAQFETYMHDNLALFVSKWDDLAATASPAFAELDCLHWFNYLAFDIIGDLAFGQRFGMLESGRDVTNICKPDGSISYVSAVEVLNRRGEVSGTLGCLPGLNRWARYLPDPFFRQGVQAVQDLAGIAFARVQQRLDGKHDPGRVDLLARLMEGRDESGEKLSREELTAEALTQLIAGSDTTSNTSCAILYHVLRSPGVLSRLQAELDAVIPVGVLVPNFAMVRNLPYLHSVIQETLRIHSTSSLGLPRVVPPGPGATVAGTYFPPGTVLSVPAYTMHHSRAIWGDDADEFVPGRWITELNGQQKRAFIPFSVGPRSCVGRNVAEMELTLIVATIFRRYDFELRQESLETREGFLRKPLGCVVGLKLREGI